MNKLHKLCLWRSTTRSLIVTAFWFSFVAIASPTSIFADTSLFTDDFEDTTLNAWVVQPVDTWSNGSSNAHSGTRKARVAGNVEGASMQKSVSTVGYSAITLSFWHDTSVGWDTQDILEAQWSPDNGSTWNTVVTLDGDDLTPLVEGGEDWIEHSVTLPESASNQAGFGVRFLATIGGTTDIIFVDDVRVGGTVSGGVQPTPTVVPTSGATPTPTTQPTVMPTPTTAPTVLPTATPTPKATPTVQPTATATPTPTVQPEDGQEPPQHMTWVQLLRLLIRLLFRNMFGLMWHL